MKRITFTLFVRLLTNQPYFVWNEGNGNDESEEEDLEFDISSYQDVAETSISEVQEKSFYLIEKAFEKSVASKMVDPFFIRDKSLDNKIKKTQWALKNAEIKTLINPVFSFEYKGFQVIAQPKIFSKLNKEISFLKISTSTRRKDILRLLFDYLVLQKMGMTIKNVSLYVLATQNYLKGDIEFCKTNYINTTKGTRSLRKVDGTILISRKLADQLPGSSIDQMFRLLQLKKIGQGENKSGLKDEQYSIIKILERGKSKQVKFKKLKTYLEQIIEAQAIKTIHPPTPRDASPFDSSLNWNLILSATNNVWEGFSGKIIKRSEVINNLLPEALSKKSIVGKRIFENMVLISDQEKVQRIISNLEENIVWYDFEAISIPFCALDHALPFWQIVSQVSIIKTINLQEQQVQNLVFDPKKISASAFIKIINAIYSEGFQYVVYNKAYENTRLKEMVQFLEIKNHRRWKEMAQKVWTIIDNTIDLANFFSCSAKKMPLILIPFLKGKYSIKIVEKYISQANLALPYKIEAYKNLEISNGMRAMELANQRALGIIGDNQWAKIKKSLKKYCENDVRAMILVYYLVKKLLNLYKN